MNGLHHHQKTLQVLSEVIQLSLGVEVFFVDDRKVAVAGTGPYRANIGSKRPTDSYVDLTITDAESQLVTEPRYTKQCYRCEYRNLCPYSMVMCRPIVRENQIKGLIGFLGFSDTQRRAMIERSSSLSELSQRLDFVWGTDDRDMHEVLAHPRTKELINAIDQGIILTSPDYHILNMNERSEHLLRTEKMGQKVGTHLPHGRGNRSEGPESAHVNPERGPIPKDLRRGGYPISDGRNLVGRLIVVDHMRTPRRTWKGCPLNTLDQSLIVGTSHAITHLKAQASSVAESDSTVLIRGETGVGKEVTAHYIHQMSNRWTGPFETVNSAAIPRFTLRERTVRLRTGCIHGREEKGQGRQIPTRS